MAWLAWTYFTAGTVVELVNVTARRARPQLRLPVLGPGQDLARSLVVAAFLLGVTAPFASVPLPPVAPASSDLGSDQAAPSAPVVPGAALVTGPALAEQDVPGAAWTDPEVTTSRPPPSAGDSLPVRTQGAPVGRADPGAGGWSPRAEQGVERPAGQPPGYVVAEPAAGRYDCLWDIAERELGDGTRWTEIYDLNVGRPQSDGRTLDDPDLVRPGWRLELPPDARPPVSRVPAAAPGGGQRVVVPGDTLWQIAEDELGDGARHQELAAAASTVTQPDGRTLQDPDLLRPGWVIPLPETAPGTTAPTSQPAPELPADAPATQTDGPETPRAPAVADAPDRAGPEASDQLDGTSGDERRTRRRTRRRRGGGRAADEAADRRRTGPRTDRWTRSGSVRSARAGRWRGCPVPGRRSPGRCCCCCASGVRRRRAVGARAGPWPSRGPSTR